MPQICQWTSLSEAATQQMGGSLAEFLRKGSVVILGGDLGAGKTVFARGIIYGMGLDDPYVTSPTFTLMNTYTEGRLPVYHFDLYRLTSAEELSSSGVEEFLVGDGVALVEWADRGGALIPHDHITIHIDYIPHHNDSRLVTVGSNGPISLEICHDFRRHCQT